MRILFTADIHINLRQKNVPLAWAQNRYKMFIEQLVDACANVDLLVVGGDIFDRVPTIEELVVYFDLVSAIPVKCLIFDGNHEATKKGKTFFTNLKETTSRFNSLVTVVDESVIMDEFSILPYCELHKHKTLDFFPEKILFTHVRGEIPPHVKPEVDLALFDRFPVVFAGDLHSHSNTQRNIVYPGSPMTTSFHRNEVDTGYIILETNDNTWKWYDFNLPQLIRKTVSDQRDMLPTEFHHTIYEIEGDAVELAQVRESELLDKKLVKRNSEASLILDKNMTILEELVEYLTYIVEIPPEKIDAIIGVYNDYAQKSGME